MHKFCDFCRTCWQFYSKISATV